MKKYVKCSKNYKDRNLYELFMEVCMDLWSYDVAITYELFRNRVLTYISNLESYLGEEAHIQLEELGVADDTGLSWEDQDSNKKHMISDYKRLLAYLDNDSNWIP
jgi:hypothetical protein